MRWNGALNAACFVVNAVVALRGRFLTLPARALFAWFPLLGLIATPTLAQLGSLDAAARTAADNGAPVAIPQVAGVIPGGDPAVAMADQLVLVDMRAVDKADDISAPTFSTDGSKLYYGKSSAGKHSVVIRDMTSGKAVGSVSTSRRVTGLALSPDERRLLICTANSPSNIGTVYEFRTGRATELPVSFGGCDSDDERPVSWIDEKTVIFDGWTLDLDNLQRRRDPDRPYPAREGPTYSTHPKAFYSLDGGGKKGLWVCDRASDYCHLVLDTTEPWRATRDLRHVVLLDYCMGCKPSFTLHALTLATRARPIREFSLIVDYADLGNSSFAHPESLRACRHSRPTLFGRVAGPKTNPLNGKVIGGDGSNKGSVRLIGTSDPVVHRALLVSEIAPVAVGDIVDMVWSPGNCSLLGSQQLVLDLRPALENPAE